MLFFFFKQKTAYEIGVRLVGSEMCIRDRGDDARLAQRGLEHLHDDVALDTAEHLLAARGEDLRDGPFSLLDERVGVDEGYLEALRGEPAHGALAGGHEADQSDRRRARRAVLGGAAHRLRQWER